MKKLLIVGSVSIVFSIVLIYQLYENSDVEWAKDVVETIADKTGIGKGIVEEKRVERKKEAEKKIEQEQTKKQEVAKLPNFDSTRIADSLSKIKAVAEAKPKKALFNSQVDSSVLKAIVKRNDSLSRAALEPPKKKKKLFNSAADESTSKSVAKTTEKKALQFFTAKIKDNQKFNHNDEVSFRLADNLTLNGKTIPMNTVFTARANVFEDRIHFILKKIEAVDIKAENYSANNEQGLPVVPELRLKNDFLLSAGTVVKFGYLN